MATDSGFLKTCAQARDSDFVLIYNTGGLGGSSIDMDPEWGSVHQGVQFELEQMGYSVLAVEHQRSDYSIPGILGEVRGLINGYASKATQLATRVGTLTEQNKDLRVILTGRCSGGMYCAQVMKLINGNKRVYSIIAGLPFWYDNPLIANSLIIESNGFTPDTFTTGDFKTIISANWRSLPSTSKPDGGSFQILRWYLKVPGHEYSWDYADIRAKIKAYLMTNFAHLA